ncbi:C3HC zinc finger-like-domain-containing protein [Yarrowia lipolytica]|uniref:YALI0F21549p n=2 Tax=Yarrowia lipolytica TaxID=4952 RepID=Q6C0U9_YARLI|nr:YALI0F21549p [Yarrowia lipolytica CLIB122]RDW28293.1 C3HC zinc finger-like-domain-containing protein [Yarrowia lipolytica]RDW42302.1 C3HC zinc finger-like-domain-containing protein [Yarrowia lipolytica]CAG78524.1 YALI0F21549p [Yarrowia lipolytica CLIB122]|eukprot:XP_505713.1 YALI0F21549p [Yarrowia lipolytica CLIB122]
MHNTSTYHHTMPTEEQLHGIMESLREVTRKSGSAPTTPTKHSPRNSTLKTATPNRFTTASSTSGKISKRPSLMERIRQVKEKDYRRTTKEITELAPTTTATSTPATYTPWSKEDFLDRVSTYTYQKYPIETSLYPKLSPYNVARYGWKCTSSKMLQCVSCGSYLAVVCGEEDDEATIKVVQDKYLGLITRNHSSRCLWKNKPCSESLGSIMGNIGRLRKDLGGKIAIPEGVEVTVDGQSVEDFFKKLLLEVDGEVNKEIDENRGLDLKEEVKENGSGSNKDSNDLTQSAELGSDSKLIPEEVSRITLAAGWRGSHNMFKCHVCSRIVKPSETFDVVQEHRDWCPYVVEKEGDKPAWWQVLTKPSKESSKKRLSNIREVYFGV